MKKNKEHKKGESTIGKIIYSFLLFMPLFAIGVTCLVNTFNNQSKEQVEIQYKYETNEVTNVSDIKENNIYKFTLYENVPSNDNYTIAYVKALYNWPLFNTTINDSIVETNSYLILRIVNQTIYLQNTSYYTTLATIALSNVSYPLSFDIVIYQLTLNPIFDETNFSASEFNIMTGTNEKDLDNIFYNSVDKVTESPLFSWATNSIIYTTMNATCTQLSITTPFIPLLMSYWLIISVIYFLYDIALMLIWLLHDKIHELRDSLA